MSMKDLGGLMKQAQAMQEKMQAMQEAIARMTVCGDAGAGQVVQARRADRATTDDDDSSLAAH